MMRKCQRCQGSAAAASVNPQAVFRCERPVGALTHISDSGISEVIGGAPPRAVGIIYLQVQVLNRAVGAACSRQVAVKVPAWDRGQRRLRTSARAPCPQPLAAAVASRLQQLPAFRPSARSHRSPLDGRLWRSARERVLRFIIRPCCRAHLSPWERLRCSVHRIPLFVG